MSDAITPDALEAAGFRHLRGIDAWEMPIRGALVPLDRLLVTFADGALLNTKVEFGTQERAAHGVRTMSDLALLYRLLTGREMGE